MEQSHSWEANSSSASQGILRVLWNLKVHRRDHNSAPLDPVLSQISPIHVHLPISWSIFHCLRPSKGSVQVCDFSNSAQYTQLLGGSVISASPNPKSGGPPTFICPLLHIQCIRSHAALVQSVSIRSGFHKKVKVTLEEAMNAQRGSRGIALLFLLPWH
jgi:hypothetical protein